MNELIDYIRKLRREEGIPLHYRRGKVNNRVVWYIWYGYTSIADRASLREAQSAVDIAVDIHRAIYPESKAA